ncbi:MAG: GerW family sporulation protein [Oscillospiraceae bacterium]|nr:GerW family sporulation protein [Oscillospiraceae bacterium]
MDDKVKDLVGTAMSKIKEMSDADTIIGDAIKIDGNITIIPVSKVSYGFAAGGSDLPSKSNSGLFGGGTGGGVTIQPLAFIVVSDGDVKLLQLNQDKSSTGAIVNLVPELFDKIQGLFSKNKSKKGDDEPSDIAPQTINTDGLNLSLDDDDDFRPESGGTSNFAGEFDF